MTRSGAFWYCGSPSSARPALPLRRRLAPRPLLAAAAGPTVSPALSAFGCTAGRHLCRPRPHVAPRKRALPLPPGSPLPRPFVSLCPSVFLLGSTDSTLTSQGRLLLGFLNTYTHSSPPRRRLWPGRWRSPRTLTRPSNPQALPGALARGSTGLGLRPFVSQRPQLAVRFLFAYRPGK